MKGFIISICVIALIFGLVFFNSLYVLRITDNLIGMVDSLDSNNYIIMNEILDFWDNNSFIIQLSSSTKETDKIDDMLASLEAMYESDSFLGLEEKKALLINYIKLINSHEKVSFDNIL
ncbi:MAG: hypothetical protein J6A95_02080 [Clostridia bacterium]|nr:hypothetical protein [Clostridia bacterium]